MDLEEVRKTRNVGFLKTVGFEFTEVREGYARGELKLDERHGNPIGSVHGGVFFTIADNVGGVAACSYDDRKVTTVAGEMHYLRPAMSCAKLIGESREVKVGKKLAIFEVMISDENGRELALATMTYQYLEGDLSDGSGDCRSKLG